MAETMASLYEAKTAKKVYLYRNGFRNTQPKCMIVNNKQIRDFNYFLSRVTSGLHAPLAVRTIYTPSEGHRVKNLDDLQTGHYYVAGVGSENFKKIKYGGELLKSPTKRLPRQEFLLPQRSQQQLSLTAPVVSRYRLPEKPFVIHVFRNGDEKYRGARVLLPRKIMGSWEHVLELVTEKAGLITPAKRICTLDGRTIHAVSEIQDGGKYVALEGSRPFQKVAYCAIDEKKMLFTKARAVARFRHRSDTVSGSEGVDGAQSDSSRSHHAHPAAAARPRRRKKSIRPMAGRKNKEGREKAIKDHREDSIFGGSPDLGASLGGQKMPSPPLRSSLTSYYMGGPGDSGKEGVSDSNTLRDSSGLHQIDEVAEASPNAPPAGGRSSKQKAAASPGGGRGGGGGGRGGASTGTTPTPAAGGAGQKGQPFHAPSHSSTPKPGGTGTEYVEKSQGGVFRAKSERDDVAGAETIQEGGETQVERPIDQEEAQEVEEEVEQDTSGKLGSKNKLQPSSRSHSNKTSPSLSKRASPSPSNKASPSPVPSNKPSPSPAPSNKPSPSPVPSNKPSPAPPNKPSPSPAPSNKPSPSPVPSNKPSPAASNKPSPVPSKKPSPSPAPSNKPTPSPAPSNKPTPSPAPSNKPSPRGGTTPVAATPNSSRHSRASQALPSSTTT